MARIARVIAPRIPHHITQRGNRRQKTFFLDDDYRMYLNLMADWCKRHKVEVWAYCLMPNHVHLLAVPESEDGLRRAIGEAHRRYTRHVNFREGWKGHLWQGRGSTLFPMEESYFIGFWQDMLNSILCGHVLFQSLMNTDGAALRHILRVKTIIWLMLHPFLKWPIIGKTFLLPELRIRGFKKYGVMNAQDDLSAMKVFWKKWRTRWEDAFVAVNPDQGRRLRRIKYGVPKII